MPQKWSRLMLGARSWPRDCRSNLFQSQLMLVETALIAGADVFQCRSLHLVHGERDDLGACVGSMAGSMVRRIA